MRIAVVPGQTVHVAVGVYSGNVTLTRSGTADQPITFAGDSTGIGAIILAAAGFRLTGVPDVVLSHLHLGSGGVSISDSSDITVESGTITSFSGQTSDVTIARNVVTQSPSVVSSSTPGSPARR